MISFFFGQPEWQKLPSGKYTEPDGGIPEIDVHEGKARGNNENVLIRRPFNHILSPSSFYLV